MGRRSICPGTLAEASRRVIAEVERRKIEQALKEAAGNRGRAAELLQVSYKMLIAKLQGLRPRLTPIAYVS